MRLRRTLRGTAHGQAIMIVALMMVVLLGFIGLAVDGGQLYLTQRRARNAADAAMLGATYELCKTGDPVDAYAANVRQAGINAAFDNGFDDSLTDQDVTVRVGKEDTLETTVPGNTSEYVEVEIRADVPTYLIQLVYTGPTEVDVTAVGRCQPEVNASADFAVCVVNDSPTDGKGIQIGSSGGTVTVCYGDLGSNSPAHFSNGTTLVSCDTSDCPDHIPDGYNPAECDPEIVVHGGLAGGSTGDYCEGTDCNDPGIIEDGTCEDGLVNMPYPGPCTHSTGQISSDTTITIPDGGVYCIDGIKAANGDEITLNGPGVFFLTDDWSQNGASVVAINDAMVFLDDGVSLAATNGAIYIRTMKPETYPAQYYAGMALFSHRNNTTDIKFTGASQTIFGTVYAPNQDFVLTGHSDDLMVAQFLVGEFDLEGQGGFKVYYDDDWFFSQPPELKIGS